MNSEHYLDEDQKSADWSVDYNPFGFIDVQGLDWLNDDCKQPTTAQQQSFDDIKPEIPSTSASKKRMIMFSRRRELKPYHRPTSTASAMSESADSDDAQVKRGRGRKPGSTTKMANYARAYREAKKQETKHYEARCKELEVENSRVRAENQQVVEKFNQLAKDYENLRRVLHFDSKLAPLVARVTSQQSLSEMVGGDLPPSDVGVCIHVGGARTSIEVCDRCNHKGSLDPPSQGLEPIPLFGGDFESIAPFI